MSASPSPITHHLRPSQVAAWLVWALYLVLLGGLAATLIGAIFAPGDPLARLRPLVVPGSIRDSLVRTHSIALASTLMVVVLGALFLLSWRSRPGPSLTPLLRAPLLLHGFPAALAYLIVFGNAGWLNRALQLLFGLRQSPLPLAFSIQALLLFFTIFGLPYFLAYTIQAIGADLADFEEAGRLLGAGPVGTFRRVTLPLVVPALRAAACLAYILVAGSLAVPMLIGGGRYSLLAAEVYIQATTMVDIPRASAFALGLVLTLLLALLVVERSIVVGVRLLSRATVTPTLSPREREHVPPLSPQRGRGPQVRRRRVGARVAVGSSRGWPSGTSGSGWCCSPSWW
jgi:ABC-type Fe3+ transport system permease subunit